jgi:hypothetical protein
VNYAISQELLQRISNILTANPSPTVPVGQIVAVLSELQQLQPLEGQDDSPPGEGVEPKDG